MVKKILTYSSLAAIVALTFIGGTYLMQENNSDEVFEIGKMQQKNTLTQEQVYERNKELHKCIEISKESIVQLRKLVNSNISRVNEKNCSGLLSDIDKDNIYDKAIFGYEITSNDTSVQMYYNFCSILYSNKEPITLALTTDKLLKDFVVENEFGDRFVPTFNVKQSKDLKSKDYIKEETVGLINLADFLIDEK